MHFEGPLRMQKTFFRAPLFWQILEYGEYLSILFLHRIFWSRVPNGSTRRYNIKVSFLLPVAKCCVARARAHEERCTSFTTIIQAPSRNRKILLLPWLNTTTPRVAWAWILLQEGHNSKMHQQDWVAPTTLMPQANVAYHILHPF